MSKPRKCPLCEQGTVAPIATKVPMPYRHLTAIEPAWEVDVPTCDHCHEQLIDASTARELDAALEAAFQALQKRLVEEAIASLATVKTPRQWEKRLELSPGYLSRLKSGKESSVALTTLLSFLGQSPARRWNAVEAIWSDANARPSTAVGFVADHATVSTVLHLKQNSSQQTTSLSTRDLREGLSLESEFCLEAA